MKRIECRAGSHTCPRLFGASPRGLRTSPPAFGFPLSTSGEGERGGEVARRASPRSRVGHNTLRVDSCDSRMPSAREASHLTPSLRLPQTRGWAHGRASGLSAAGRGCRANCQFAPSGWGWIATCPRGAEPPRWGRLDREGHEGARKPRKHGRPPFPLPPGEGQGEGRTRATHLIPGRQRRGSEGVMSACPRGPRPQGSRRPLGSSTPARAPVSGIIPFVWIRVDSWMPPARGASHLTPSLRLPPLRRRRGGTRG